MNQEKFQEHVITQFDQIQKQFTEIQKQFTEIQKQFTKNEKDHGELSTKVESVRSEMHKAFNSHLRWSIGISISLVGAVFIIVKYIT